MFPLRRPRRSLVVIGALAVAVLGARAALPYAVKEVVNRKLADIPGYYAHVGDIDIALLRGAYVIRRLEIQKTGGDVPVPFVQVEAIDLSVQWKELMRGSLVGEVVANQPRVNFTNGPDEGDVQTGAGVAWQDQIKDLFPLRINRFEVVDGEVHFADFSQKPPLDLDVRDVHLEARNLTNSEDLGGSMVASIDATGSPLGLGSFDLRATVDPYTDRPTFDVDIEVRKIPLKGLNPFLKSYAGFDAEGGRMELYTEVASKDGRLTGYVKPVLTGAKVFNLEKEVEEDREGPARVAWEAMVGTAKLALANPKDGDIALKVPLRGSLDAPSPDGWEAVISVIGNAWFEALSRAIDHDITLQDVPTAAEAESEPQKPQRARQAPAAAPPEADDPSKRQDRREKRRERKKQSDDSEE